MRDVSKEGRTVLYVSHNMAAMLNICARGILLKSGRIQGHGEMIDVVRQYSSVNTECNLFQPANSQRSGDQRAIIDHFEMHPNPPQTGAPVDFTFFITRSNSKTDLSLDLAVAILTEEGFPLLQLYSCDMGTEFM